MFPFGWLFQSDQVRLQKSLYEDLIETTMPSDTYFDSHSTWIRTSESQAEPVKAFETSAQDFFCASLSMVSLLIHAAVGSLGGLGLRFPNRHGLAA
jgi:hypothetical protein